MKILIKTLSFGSMVISLAYLINYYDDLQPYKTETKNYSLKNRRYITVKDYF